MTNKERIAMQSSMYVRHYPLWFHSSLSQFRKLYFYLGKSQYSGKLYDWRGTTSTQENFFKEKTSNG